MELNFTQSPNLNFIILRVEIYECISMNLYMNYVSLIHICLCKSFSFCEHDSFFSGLIQVYCSKVPPSLTSEMYLDRREKAQPGSGGAHL